MLSGGVKKLKLKIVKIWLSVEIITFKKFSLSTFQGIVVQLQPKTTWLGLVIRIITVLGTFYLHRCAKTQNIVSY